MKLKMLLFFAVVAVLSSLLRFGHRENNLATLSDSDYYLDMAQVFAGQKAEFNTEFLKDGPHHYNRPLLPYLAGITGHYFLNDNYPAAFSILNILSAILIAFLLYRIVSTYHPGIYYSWYPSLLFLTAFSQMDFGYHILTETFGIAFAFGTSWFLYNFILRIEKKGSDNQKWRFYKDSGFYTDLFILLVLQTLSFAARETGLFTIVSFLFIVFVRKLYAKKYFTAYLLIFLVLIASKIPQLVYAGIYNTHLPSFAPEIAELLNPKYIFDAIFKLGLAFNITWIIVFIALIQKNKLMFLKSHEFIFGWSFAALGYILTGYIHNSAEYGFPLRMFFSLFPLFYIFAIRFFEDKFIQPKLKYVLGLFFILHLCISIVGVLLDSGAVSIHNIFDLHTIF